MIVQVPKTVDVNRMVASLNLSPTRSRNIAQKILYFLSRVVTHNDNYRLNEDNDGYRNICSVKMKKILGNKDYYTVLDILLNPEEPIIESDQSYHNPKSLSRTGYCLGYRLTRKYSTGEIIYKTLTAKFARASAHSIPDEMSAAEETKRYGFLLNQFVQHQLSFDKQVYDYIKLFGTELLKLTDDKNIFQAELIYNVVGRWLYYIEQIENKEIWKSVSNNNHRLCSNITNLPRILRPFLLCNNQPLGIVDISSSQPYILASVISERFFIDTGYGYNLESIYPELYKELSDNGCVSKDIDNSNEYYYSTNTGNTGTNIYSTSISNNYFNQYFNRHTGSSFMWCSFFTPAELTSISKYVQSPFNDDFYMHVIKSHLGETGSISHHELENERKKLKGSFMFVLFEDNKNHRNNNTNIRTVQQQFPGIDRWIRDAHKVIGKTKFAHLLQRAESYLLLNIVCQEFNQLHPNAAIYTIHDSVLAHQEHIPVLTSLLKNRLKETTGIDVGLKIKYPQIVPEPQIGDIDNEWENIKSITTAAKFNSVAHSVFSSNVNRGFNFLKNFEK